MPTAPWTFEVWTPDGSRSFDISTLATNRRITAGRNKGGTIDFSLDTHQLRLLAESYGTTAASLLNEGINEVRVRRGGTYLRQGGQIARGEHSGSSVDQDTSVHVVGFLDLLAYRMVEVQMVYTATEFSTIMWDVINKMQTGSSSFWASPAPSAARATMRITRGVHETIGAKDRTYDIGKVVKDVLVQSTVLQTTDTDVEIDQAKVFNVYQEMGHDLPLVVFELGRNIIDYKVPRDTTALANRVLTTGTGTGGGTMVQSIDEDAASETSFTVRQHLMQLNSVQDEATLSDHGAGYVASAKDPITVPQITVDLNVDVKITDFWVGDRVTVRIVNDDLPVPIDGLFRVEEIDLTITDEGAETAQLSLSAA